MPLSLKMPEKVDFATCAKVEDQLVLFNVRVMECNTSDVTMKNGKINHKLFYK